MTDNTSFKNEDSFVNDENQRSRILWRIELTTFIAYVCIFCFGVPANVYVLCRLWKFAKENREKYKNGTGLGLFVMATSDLISLLAILLQHFRVPLTISASDLVKNIVCKILIFATHTMTSVSIWSWLLMSTLRYLAIRHPLLHLRLWRAPYRAIALIVFLSVLTNFWLIFTVSNGTMSCTQDKIILGGVGGEDVNRWLHLIECIWSYCIPVGVILYMDTMVFLCCPQRSTRAMPIGKRNGASVRGSIITSTAKRKANRGLWKWLTIAFVDIMLNTPENLYRLLLILDFEVITPDYYYFYSFRMTSQVLYYSQFAFNAIYLSLFVFDKGIRPNAPLSSSQSLGLPEAKASITQGCSSEGQCRQNRYRSQIM